VFQEAGLRNGNHAGEASEVTFGAETALGDRITIPEMLRLRDAGETVVLLDARSDRTFLDSDFLAAGAIRIDPNRPVTAARKAEIPHDAWVVPFCACPNDRTSVAVAEELRDAGWPRARALQGGWEAWQEAGLPVESKAVA
jgi:rhodanese-related sulfurtransferase